MTDTSVPHATASAPCFPFQTTLERPAITWPGDARIAFWIKMAIETRSSEAPAEGRWKDPRHAAVTGPFQPDHRAFAQHEYGARIGVFRVLDRLERHGLRATAAVNSISARRYPDLMTQLARRGDEIVGHGRIATEMATSQMSEAEERAEIRESLDVLESVTGLRPRGWMGQDYGESARTPMLLDEAGLDYVGDWPDDDQPWLLDTPRRLVSVPAQQAWDDLEQLWFRSIPMPVWRDSLIEAFDVLAEEGGRSFCLTLHPWLIGMPHRIRYLSEALEEISARPGVWRATGAEIADHARATLTASGDIEL